MIDKEIQLFELFHQIDRRIWKLLAPVMKAEERSITDMIVLTNLHKKRTSRITGLAAMIGIPLSTFTGILDRLEEQGLLKRSQDPEDRRSVLISATPKLDDLFQGWMKPVAEVFKKRFKDLSESRLAKMIQDLQFILECLDEKNPCTEAPETKNRRPASV